jgi:gamma-F420-2:alpha-L-glutamate ligase
MKIWFLRDGEAKGDAQTYEMNRFIEVGEKRGHIVRFFDPGQFKILCGTDDPENIFVDSIARDKPDVIMSRMGSATTYLGLSVLRHMLRNGVMVINRASAVEATIDKLRSMQILAEKNIPIPKTMFARCPVDSELIMRKIGYPVVVKTLKGTQGGGVYLSETPERLRDLSELLVHQGFDHSPVLFQEFIESSHGRDLRVFVVGRKILACMERKSTDGSFKANISRGGAGKQIAVTPQIEKIVLDTCDALNLEIAGVDLLYTEDGFKVCEANVSPGFEGLEKYCDVSAPDAIYAYIEARMAKERGLPSSGKNGNIQSVSGMSFFTGALRRLRNIAKAA